MADENEIVRRDEAARDRDESARDRDEMSRTRDELSRDRDAFSQRATKAARNVQTWATIVVIILVAGLFYTTEQRKDAIDEIQASAIRIEQAATNTEQILVDVEEQRQTPEARAQAERVRQALEEIATIRSLICELPELVDAPECNP